VNQKGCENTYGNFSEADWHRKGPTVKFWEAQGLGGPMGDLPGMGGLPFTCLHCQ